jgi:O-antigen ligase
MSLWKGSLNMINDNSMFGVGLSNYNKALNDQILSGNIKPIRQDPSNYTAGMNHAHSQYLDIFAKTGVIGFLTLMYFIMANYYYFYNNLKNNRNNISGFMGLVVLMSYMSYMVYHTVLSHHQSILFMTFSLAILAGLSYSNAHNKKD